MAKPKKSAGNKENVTPPKPSKATNLADVTTKKAPPKPPKQAKWSAAHDAELVGVLTDEQANGNQSDNGWKSCVWQAAMLALAGSEDVTGGAPKDLKKCSRRWDSVSSIFNILLDWAYSYDN